MEQCEGRKRGGLKVEGQGAATYGVLLPAYMLPAWFSSQWSMPASLGSARGQAPVASMWALSPARAAFSRCSA